MSLPAEKESFSFADCLLWDEPEQAEIINGEIYLMVPPSSTHQRISMELSRQIANYLDGKRCQVYSAPFAVRLFETDTDSPEDVDTMVEPDISVICDRNKIDEHGCKGAPDLVIEILSPSTNRHDRIVKYSLYQKSGVREYWIISPEERSVQVFLLDNKVFVPHEVYGPKDMAKVNILDDCSIDLSKVFPDN